MGVFLGYGISQFDLSGTGSSRLWAIRVDRTFGRFLVAEAGASMMRPALQSGDTTKFIVPELQLQVQLPIARVAPYIGAGIGAAIHIADDRVGGVDRDPAFSVAAGSRLWITRRLGLRAELRLRGIETRFTGSTADWVAGASWRF